MRCIDLVKLLSEAVGSQREDSRAAAHLFALWSPVQIKLRPGYNNARPQAQCATLARLPTSIFLLDSDIPGSH